MALERLTYDRTVQAVTYRSDKSEGPTAGTETVDPLEFLARVLTHIPDKGQVTTRYDGWDANRPRGMRRQAEPAAVDSPAPLVPAPRLPPTDDGPKRSRPDDPQRTPPDERPHPDHTRARGTA